MENLNVVDFFKVQAIMKKIEEDLKTTEDEQLKNLHQKLFTICTTFLSASEEAKNTILNEMFFIIDQTYDREIEISKQNGKDWKNLYRGKEILTIMKDIVNKLKTKMSMEMMYLYLQRIDLCDKFLRERSDYQKDLLWEHIFELQPKIEDMKMKEHESEMKRIMDITRESAIDCDISKKSYNLAKKSYDLSKNLIVENILNPIFFIVHRMSLMKKLLKVIVNEKLNEMMRKMILACKKYLSTNQPEEKKSLWEEIFDLENEIYFKRTLLGSKDNYHDLNDERYVLRQMQEYHQYLLDERNVEMINLIRKKIITGEQFFQEKDTKKKNELYKKIIDMDQEIRIIKYQIKEEKAKKNFPRSLETEFENILSFFDKMETKFPCPDFYRLRLKIEIAKKLTKPLKFDMKFNLHLHRRAIFGGFPRDLIVLVNEMKKFEKEYPNEDFWNPNIGDFAKRTVLPKDIDVHYPLPEYTQFDLGKFPVTEKNEKHFGYVIQMRESVNTFNFNYPSWGIDIRRIRAVMTDWQKYSVEEIYCDIDCIINNHFFRKFKPDMESNVLAIRNGKLILFHVPNYYQQHDDVKHQMKEKYQKEVEEVSSKYNGLLSANENEHLKYQSIYQEYMVEMKILDKKIDQEIQDNCRHCKLSLGKIIHDICKKRTYVVPYAHAREERKLEKNQIAGRKIRVRRIVRMLQKGWKLENLKDLELTYLKVSLDDPSKIYEKERIALYLPHCDHYMNEEYFYEFCEKQLETEYHVKCCENHVTDIV